MNLPDGTTLTIVAQDEPGRSVLVLRGEIDGETCAQVDEAAAGAVDAGGVVVLDLAEVSFVDSAGLRTMVVLERRARASGGSLELRNPSRTVTRLLELTSLDTHFTIREQ